MKHLIPLFILSWIAFIPTLAQSIYKGTVTNPRQEALENATVLLLSRDSMVSGTITDKRGVYAFEDMKPGDYRIQVSMLGYQAAEKPVVWKAGMKGLPDFVLQEDSLFLSEVVVEASRADNISYTSNATIFHLSENALKNSVNLYEALQEIPKLVVDPTEKQIKTSDGSTPLVLINGVNRPGYLNSLDPADIIAVELIDNPSSRYRGQESTRTVLNVRVKRKKEFYTNLNLSARQHVEAHYSRGDASFEIGNSNFSGYLNANYWYNKEDVESQYYLESGEVIRAMKGKYPSTLHAPRIVVGGDWVISDRDYLLLDSSTDFNKDNSQSIDAGTSTTSGVTSDIRSQQVSESKYVANSTALFYRHTFENKDILEATGRFGYTWNKSDGWREEHSATDAYRESIVFDNNRTSYTLELNYALNSLEKVGMNFGSNSYFQNFDVEYQNNAAQNFRYKEGREYLYGELFGKDDSKFTYSLSVGLDMVFTRSNGVKNHYINFLPQVSLAYKFTPNSVLRFYGSRNRQSPSATYLNPYNTSADSMFVTVGNPYLTPMLENQLSLRYEWNYKNFYLNPFVSYYYYTDVIESCGELQGNVYHSSYENIGSHSKLSTGLSARLRLGKIGNISANVSYTKDFYDNYPFSGNSLGYSCYLFLQYKKVSFNSYIYHTGPYFDQIGKYRYKTESGATLTWRVAQDWRINVMLRYFMPQYNDEMWNINGDYYSYTRYEREHLMPMVGFSYTFRSKNAAKKRQRQQLYNNEERFEMRMKK